MTAYVAIADSEIDPESPIITSLMTKFRDNPIAITEGSTGAPKIQTAALEQTGGSEAVTQDTIRANAVGQSELKNTTQGVTSPGLAQNDFYLFQFTSAATFAFFPYWSAASGAADITMFADGGTWGLASYPQFAGKRNSASTGTHTATIRYVTASRPWDLGDGEVRNFIYLLIDNGTLEILGMSSCIDPAWNFLVQRRALKNRRSVTVAQADQDPSKRDALLAELLTLRRTTGALSMAEKVAPAAIFPHPWVEHPDHQDMTGKSVLLLDPPSEEMERFANLDVIGAEDDETVLRLIERDYIRFDTTPLARAVPPGVIAVSPRWRWTPQ